MPKEPQRDIEIVFVENVRQVFAEALLPAIARPKVSTNGKATLKTSRFGQSENQSRQEGPGEEEMIEEMGLIGLRTYGTYGTKITTVP